MENYCKAIPNPLLLLYLCLSLYVCRFLFCFGQHFYVCCWGGYRVFRKYIVRSIRLHFLILWPVSVSDSVSIYLCWKILSVNIVSFSVYLDWMCCSFSLIISFDLFTFLFIEIYWSIFVCMVYIYMCVCLWVISIRLFGVVIFSLYLLLYLLFICFCIILFLYILYFSFLVLSVLWGYYGYFVKILLYLCPRHTNYK